MGLNTLEGSRLKWAVIMGHTRAIRNRNSARIIGDTTLRLLGWCSFSFQCLNIFNGLKSSPAGYFVLKHGWISFCSRSIQCTHSKGRWSRVGMEAFNNQSLFLSFMWWNIIILTFALKDASKLTSKWYSVLTWKWAPEVGFEHAESSYRDLSSTNKPFSNINAAFTYHPFIWPFFPPGFQQQWPHLEFLPS